MTSIEYESDRLIKDTRDPVQTPDYVIRQPEDASIVRALDLSELNDFLFLNWVPGEAGRFLEASGKSYNVISSVKELIERLNHNLNFGFTDPLEIDDECNFEEIQRRQEKKTIIFGDLSSSVETHRELFASQAVQSVLKKGGLVILRRGWNKNNALACEMIEAVVGDQLQTERLLTFPSIEKPIFLFRENFLVEKEGAWRLISSYLSESGAQRDLGSLVLPEIWSDFDQNNKFPTRDAPCYSVIYETKKFDCSPIKIDFLKVSAGLRKDGFHTETKKSRSEETVIRTHLNSNPVEVHDLELEASRIFIHTPINERYQRGQAVSQIWLSSLTLRAEPDSFLTQISEYFKFLERNIGQHDSKNFDLLPDNLIYDSTGEIHAIDQEWQINSDKFDPAVAFCRGVFYFLFRHARVLDTLDSVRRFGNSHHEFLVGTLKVVGLDAAVTLEKFYELERVFRDHTLQNFQAIEPRSLAHRRFGDAESVFIGWQFGRAIEDVAQAKLSEFGSLGMPKDSGRNGSEIVWSICGDLAQYGMLYVQLPRKHGPARFEHIRITGEYSGDSSILLELHGHRKVSDYLDGACSNFGLDGDHESTNELVCVKLPDETVSAETLKIELSFCWPDLTYGPDGDSKLLARLWEKEYKHGELVQKLDVLNQEYLKKTQACLDLEAKLDLITRSKGWRLLEFIRRIVYSVRPRSGSSPTRPLTAIEILNQPAIQPAQQFNLSRQQLSVLAAERDEADRESLLISILMPVHNTPKVWLVDAVRSVQEQTYSNWELIIVDDGSTLLETRECLDRLDDPRFKLIHLTSSSGISGASNFGLEAARGEVIALMDHDDILSKHALAYISKAFHQDDADLVYSDETVFNDEMKELSGGYLGSPLLKPDYSPDLLLSHNYITHFFAARKNLIDQIGGFRSIFDGAQDYDLILRLTELTSKVSHISETLYHWRQSIRSTSLDSGVKPEAHLRGKKALTDALDRRGIRGKVLMGNAPHFFRVRREIIGNPSVDIVIPFRDQPLMLQQCIDSLLARTSYSNFRIIGVDNGSVEQLTIDLQRRYAENSSQVKFVELDVPFNFAEIVNYGVEQSTADHVVLLNNDIQIINFDWLESLLEHSQRPEIGAVGGKLYYPDDTIQHAGIVVGIGDYAGHPHKHEQGGFSGYINRLNVIQNVSAVTGAMLMCKTAVYREVGGLNAEHFKVACNDVDFCLRLIEQGYRNVFTPFAQAYHHESISRGYEDTPEKKARFEHERSLFQARHSAYLAKGDPYYNKNLLLDREDVVPRSFDKQDF